MKRKIGVWGLGVVGKSVISYLASDTVELQVLDKRLPTEEEQAFLNKHSCMYRPESELNEFLDSNNEIIPSPGIDLRKYNQYSHKWQSELDLFSQAWHKPLIAVTGTVGKTSVVHLLSKILEHYSKQVATGGNIGLGMLDLLDQQQQADVGLLELSSFQLELCKTFAPTVAVWTNFYPNHLDRHGTVKEYFDAKYKILAQQTQAQHTIVPLELGAYFLNNSKLTEKPLVYFSTTAPSSSDKLVLKANDILYYFDNTSIVKYTSTLGAKTIFDSALLPSISYKANWVILIAVCDQLGLPLEKLTSLPDIDLPAHRLALVATINGVSYYNDSKSTIAQATLAAVEHLQHQPLYLLLGGVSKGVDRKPLIQQLKNKVKKIVCFGAESELLYSYCIEVGIPAEQHLSLETAFKACANQAQPKDIVLLSPAGASFDLFKNYQERGACFEQLVKALEQQEGLT